MRLFKLKNSNNVDVNDDDDDDDDYNDDMVMKQITYRT